MSEHTPGPWVVEVAQGKYPYVVADQGKGWDNPLVCSLYEDVTPEDSVTIGAWLQANPNAAPNARLIAAAPDLLAALKTLLDAASVGHYPFDETKGWKHPALQAARSAITKATQEPTP